MVSVRFRGDCQDKLASAAFTFGLGLMSPPVTPKALSRAAILQGEPTNEIEVQEVYREIYGLYPSEIRWRDRYPALKERGYLLRRRYELDWKPSWTGTSTNPMFCEDSILLRVGVVRNNLFPER